MNHRDTCKMTKRLRLLTNTFDKLSVYRAGPKLLSTPSLLMLPSTLSPYLLYLWKSLLLFDVDN